MENYSPSLFIQCNNFHAFEFCHVTPMTKMFNSKFFPSCSIFAQLWQCYVYPVWGGQMLQTWLTSSLQIFDFDLLASLSMRWTYVHAYIYICYLKNWIYNTHMHIAFTFLEIKVSSVSINLTLLWPTYILYLYPVYIPNMIIFFLNWIPITSVYLAKFSSVKIDSVVIWVDVATYQHMVLIPYSIKLWW